MRGAYVVRLSNLIRISEVLRNARGRGVKQDNGEAAQWYRKATDQGPPFIFGLKYTQGPGVNLEISEAAQWFRKATDRKSQGMPPACGEAAPSALPISPRQPPLRTVHLCQLRRHGGGGRRRPKVVLAVQGHGLPREGVPLEALEGGRSPLAVKVRCK